MIELSEMKFNRCLFFLLFISISVHVSAQMYVRGGAVAHHYNMRQYNLLVDSYNKNTFGLTTDMPYQDWMFGPDFGFGKRTYQFGWELSFRSGKGIISAAGIDTAGTPFTRDVMTKEASFCAGMYIRILGPLAPLYMSFDGELSIWTNKTSVNGEPYRTMDKGPTLFITPGLKYMPFKGWFTPVIHMYYSSPLLKGFQKELWADMDPIGFPDVDEEDFWVRHGHFGIGVSFVIGKQGED